jgi:hypothetical protein
MKIVRRVFMKNKYVLYFLRALLLFAVLTVISSISFSLIGSAGSIRQFRGFWTNELYHRVNFFYSLLVLFSLNDVFALNDPYLKSDREGNREGSVRFVLKRPYFWIEYVTFSICVASFPFFPPFSNLSNGFFADNNCKYPICLLIVLSAVLLIKLVCFASALNWWAEKEKRKKAGDCIELSFGRFILKLFFTSVIAIAGGFAVSVTFPMFSTAVTVLGTLKLATIIVTLILIAAVILALAFFRQAAASMQRRKLLKRIVSLGRSEGYSVETGKKPYGTSLPDNEYNFLLQTGDRRIACRFVSAARKSVPVYLHENGNVIYEDKKLLITHSVTQKYAFKADEGTEKIIIVCPCNGNILIKNDREERLADSGDKCMEYRIFNASGLLNAIERGYF